MTSTPMDHPADDDKQTHPEDQGDRQAHENAPDDLVDEETKRLSEAEAAQHEDTESAQKDAAEEGGYGH